MAPPLHFKLAMKNLLLLGLSLLLLSCGQQSPLKSVLAQLSQPRGKRVVRGPIFESKSALKSSPRVLNPRTPEDFAINEFQDYAEIHKGWSQIGYGLMQDQPDIATAERPKVYNPKIILNELNYLKKEMPKELLNIYQGKTKFPENRIFDEKVIEYWGRKINTGSDKARRWQQKMLPLLSEWAKESIKDVRGYMFFQYLADVQLKLDNFGAQDFSFQEKAKSALINLCFNNNQKRSDCELEIQDAIIQQKVYPVYTNYISKAKETYNSFFKLRSLNPEAKFIDNVLNMTVTRPRDNDFAKLFQTTVERNWTLEGKPIRQLALNYVNYPKPDQTSIEINAGAISHVENFRRIIIDPTLDSFTLSKTLAHEFGHVLGFVDCYVEFYDEAKAEAVYYEIDSENIMCSLNGHVNEQHYELLMRSY